MHKNSYPGFHFDPFFFYEFEIREGPAKPDSPQIMIAVLIKNAGNHI